MAARARDKTGSTAIRTRKSTPIEFISVVRSDRNGRAGCLTSGGWGRRSDLRFAAHDTRQPAAASWGSKPHIGRAGLECRLLRGRERFRFGGTACPIGRFVDLLDYKFMERGTSGRYDIEPGATLRAPKFNFAEFDSLGMKPLSTAVRARHGPALTV
jgi:hypothetical protein